MRSREVLKTLDDYLIFSCQVDWPSKVYDQGNTHRFTPRGRYNGCEHVLIDDASAGRVARSRQRREIHFPRFPPKRMDVGSRRQPESNEVGRNVVRLNDVVGVGIL